ncbi:hypothetical protein QFC22_002867 [Naganishia vaughanmartiniae]|uniref:Uncharacterized protein n=1 Tax=Naganishia vaughanmartiniae TaxID=1424756 RepID=A0ACC2XC36_9TREE|nr:hypothetical protein QFC22_002867 [Naganishia vaughanmartiniae]
MQPGPAITDSHAKRSVEQEQGRRVKRVRQSRRPAEEGAGQQGTLSIHANGDSNPHVSSTAGNRSAGVPTVHRHHSHLRERGAGGRETRTTNLLRQASMRRRNVWDDLDDLSSGERAPPPAFGAVSGATGRGLPGASPLAREVVHEGTGDTLSNARAVTNGTGVPAMENGDALPMHPDMDPNDPPPPFPETEEGGQQRAERTLVPPRSPPPSFEFAVAQLQVNATTTERPRRGSTVSSASSASSMIAYGPPTEMQSRVMEERQAWERDLSEGFSLEERLERAAQRAKLFERDDQPTSGIVVKSEPVSDAAIGGSTTHATAMGAGEPVSRFSKEEKGKGKEVEEGVNGIDDVGAAEPVKTVATPQEMPSVEQVPLPDTRAHESKPTKLEGKPSRSYIKQSSARLSESREPLSPGKNDSSQMESKVVSAYSICNLMVY